MRRADLRVGDRLYWAPGRGWADRSDDGCWGEAVVVSVEPHEEVSGERRGRKGDGVLVDLDVRPLAGDPYHRRRVVYLSALRGPYEAVKARVDAAQAERLAQEAAERDHFAGERELRDRLIARASELGLVGVHAARHGVDTVKVTLATLAQLLDVFDLWAAGGGRG